MSAQRFKQKLQEQLLLLQQSCRNYDGGLEIEAYRIAQALRILFHKTTDSPSIFSRLKMDGTKMLTSTDSNGHWTHFVKVQINLGASTPVLCLPLLGTRFGIVPFFEWWHAQTAYRFEGRSYTRRQIVLEAANSDGGAHVNPTLARFYQDLADGLQGFAIDGANLEYANGAPYNQSTIQRAPNTHLAMLRQFGHEVLMSSNHFVWLT